MQPWADEIDLVSDTLDVPQQKNEATNQNSDEMVKAPNQPLNGELCDEVSKVVHLLVNAVVSQSSVQSLPIAEVEDLKEPVQMQPESLSELVSNPEQGIVVASNECHPFFTNSEMFDKQEQSSMLDQNEASIILCPETQFDSQGYPPLSSEQSSSRKRKMNSHDIISFKDHLAKRHLISNAHDVHPISQQCSANNSLEKDWTKWKCLWRKVSRRYREYE